MRGSTARRCYFKKNAYLHLKHRGTLLALAAMTALVQTAAVGIRFLSLQAIELFSFSFTSDRWQESVNAALILLSDFIVILLLAPVLLGIFRAAELAASGEKISCCDTLIYFSSAKLLRFAYSFSIMQLTLLFAASRMPQFVEIICGKIIMRYPAHTSFINAVSPAMTAALWLMTAFIQSRTMLAPTILRENPRMTFFMTLRCSVRAAREQSGEELALVLSFIPHLLPAVLTCGVSLLLTIPVLALTTAGMNEWIYSLSAEAIESGAYLKKYQYTIRRAGMKRIFAARQGKE